MDTVMQEEVKELLSLSAKTGKLTVPYWLDWDRFTMQPGSIPGGIWKVDRMMRNALYILPQIMLIACTGKNNCSVQDIDLLNSKPRISLTIYTMRFHLMVEAGYASLQKLHLALALQYNIPFTNQSNMNKDNPTIGACVARVVMMCNRV